MTELFGKKMLAALVVISLLSLAATVWIAIDVDRSAPPPVGANSFSYSADGHRAFAALLKDVGVPVLTSRYDTDRRIDPTNLLVAIEPSVDARGDLPFARLEKALLTAKHAVLVLPKRKTVRDDAHAGWVGSATMLSEAEVRAVFTGLGLNADVVRPAKDPAPEDWSNGLTSGAPDIDFVQLLRTKYVEPLVSCPDGILVGRLVTKRRVILISDPDLLNNAGIGRGANAKIALAALAAERPRDGVVVLDESTRGSLKRPGLVTEVFAFPMAITVIQAAIVLLLYLWSGLGRFGKPLRLPRSIARGKRALIDNVADLFLYGGRPRFVIGRYLDLCVRDVLVALHVGDGAATPEAYATLARIGANRGVAEDISGLAMEVRAAEESRSIAYRRSVDLARRLDQWRKEMLGESR